MRQHKLNMNPKKCAFGVQAGNFLGKIQPFSSLLRLKQEQEFKWEEQHQQAFEEIKHYLSNPPVLSSPKRGRPLKLYVSTLEVSIGSLLVQDNKEGKENAVCYMSRTLIEVDRKYSAIERLCLGSFLPLIPSGRRNCLNTYLFCQCLVCISFISKREFQIPSSRDRRDCTEKNGLEGHSIRNK
ncbi:unnamed protein product [Prunus armeniaca]